MNPLRRVFGRALGSVSSECLNERQGGGLAAAPLTQREGASRRCYQVPDQPQIQPYTLHAEQTRTPRSMPKLSVVRVGLGRIVLTTLTHRHKAIEQVDRAQARERTRARAHQALARAGQMR